MTDTQLAASASGAAATAPSTGGTGPTPEQQAYAYVFLNALKGDKDLAQRWSDALAKAGDPKYAIKDRVSYLDNFLADNGYTTTAEAVLTLLKTPWWNDYMASRQPNMQSDRFVQDLLQDSSLYAQWGAVIDQATASGSLDAADQFLQAHGYACTALQVNASFEKMRNQNLNYWTNLYGLSTVQGAAGGTAQAGPVVIVYGDSTVSVGPIKLFGFKYAQGVLTWTQAGAGGLLTNPHSGSLTFSQITLPRTQDGYVGAMVSGTITYPDGGAGPLKGKYSLYARVGDPPPNTPGHVDAPPSVDQGGVKGIANALAPYVMIGFALTMVFGAVAKVGEWTGASDFIKKKWQERTRKSAQDAKEQTAREQPEVPQDEFSAESTTVRDLQQQIAESPDPAVREQLEEQVTEARAEQAKAEQSEDENLTEKGQQSEDLESDLAGEL